MVLGWRRAFCTSIPRDRDSSGSTSTTMKQDKSNPATPKFSSKLGFFSNPSTPRLQSQPISSPALRCRTTCSAGAAPATAPCTAAVPAASIPQAESPKLQCKTTRNSPRFFQRSNPSSPRSPSTFSFLKSTLRPSKTRCGICLNSVKSGQGTAIFTAECTHSFHFPCVAAHFRKQGTLTCPVCNSQWNEMPLLSIHNVSNNQKLEEEKKRELCSSPRTPPSKKHPYATGKPILKVYNDDEPLMSPTSGARFNPIPESDENDDEENENLVGEFQGFFPETNVSPSKKTALTLVNMDVSILPDAAVVSVGRSSQTYVVVLKVRAPTAPAKTARRAPIDLVMVLDVGGRMTSEKLHMMKQAMRLVVSSLSSADRLSIVAFSSTSKRLLPLRRMTTAGRRSARRIVDAVVALDGTLAGSANDALKKAAKVLEDRREKNPTASIILLSDGHDDRSTNQRRHSSMVCSTRFPQLDIPVHSVNLKIASAYRHALSSEDALSKCIGGLLSVVVQDVRIQLGFISGSGPAEITGVYSCMGRPMALGSGLVRVGDMHAEEERELLVELKVPSMNSFGAHHVLSVRCSYQDPSTQGQIQGKEQALWVPRPHAARSSTPSIDRLRSLFVATRAVAESRRLVDRHDLGGAHHMLSSARALLLQSSSGSADEFVRGLEAELLELHWRRQNQVPVQQQQQIRRRGQNPERENIEEKSTEPLTPTSAWRAAERLAKVAIMRKSLNRVSDLHGFENARF